MAERTLTRPLRILLFLCCFLPAAWASAQVDQVDVYGTVKDYTSAKKLDGVTVTVYKNGGKLAEVVTNANGKYEFNLDYGSEFKLEFSKPGIVSKNVQIDTRNVPEEDRVGGHAMNIDMTLFSELPGIDFSLLQQPFGKAKYDGASEVGFVWDMDYTAQMRSGVDKLMKEYDDRKKREANAEEDYAKAMAAGDAAMTAADYKKAVDSFNNALVAKPNDAKATAKLSDAKMKQEAADSDKKRAEQYAALIKEADGLFNKKDYENAKAKYTQADDLKDDPYPKGRIKECQAFIDELAKKAEEDKKKKELDDKYNAAIAAADAAFKGDQLDNARTKYTEASGLKPDEKYPKDQLALVAKKMDDKAKKDEEERKQKELEAKYQAALVAADAAFKATNYDQARTKYTEASGLKPDEKYPKDQLAAIDKKLEELAKKADEEKKAKELEANYNAAIAKADAAFKADKFDDAKAGYNEALGFKPKEKYPTDQLAAIEKKLADLAKKEEEDRKKKELDDQYNAAIATADQAFHAEKWDDARNGYNAALKLKAQEKYPKDQLAAIDKAIADKAKKDEEERKQQEIDAKYKAAIDAADGLLKGEKYDQAKAKYTEASGVKPAENYPKEKIAEIDARLAELARKAEEDRKNKELNDKYDALVAKADKGYDAKAYADALNDYKDALALKPDEQHPKDRIADIQGKLDAAAQAKAEKERLEREAKEKEQHYADLVAGADKAFAAKDYTTAKNGYTDALGIKPEEKHPKDQLAEIDRILKEMADKAEADRLKAEQDAAEKARLEEERRRKEAEQADVETRYQEAITKGDLAFKQENFDGARDRYTEALTIKPAEQYPKDRIAEIEKLLADRARAQSDADAAEAERRRLAAEKARQDSLDAAAARLAADNERDRLAAEKAKEDQYRKAIADADAAMGGKAYSDARDLYTQALDIMPGEAYPQSKIEQIDKLLAEQERQRREAETASRSTQDEPPPRKENSTIDIKKEQEAEQFMREAKAREEAEKYGRIKKLKSDVAEQQIANGEKADTRRDAVVHANENYVQGPGQYSGTDKLREKNEAELEALRNSLAERHEQVVNKAQQERSDAFSGTEAQEEHVVAHSEAEAQKHQERVDKVEDGREAWQQAQEDRTAASKARTEKGAEQVQALSDGRVGMQEKGNALTEGNRDRVGADKDRLADRQQQMANRSDDARMAAKEKLDNTPMNQQRSFSDYNRGKLANEYPQGVTEESYTEGNKVIIRRVVVQGNKADTYSKVIAKWGTFYFKNGQSISEQIWSRDTED